MRLHTALNCMGKKIMSGLIVLLWNVTYFDVKLQWEAAGEKQVHLWTDIDVLDK